MLAHTQAFETKIKELGRQLNSVITYTLNNNEIKLGVDDLNSISLHYQGSILKSIMRQLDVDSNIDIPVGTEFNFKFGVKVRQEEELIDENDDGYDYIDYGTFIVRKSEKQEDVNSYLITCYDKMLYAMTDYHTPANITFPITIRNYLNAICSELNIEFASNQDSFTNYNKTIPNELYLDSEGNSLEYTFRDVLDELAQVTASTICINSAGKLEVRYITDTQKIIDEESLKDINVNFDKLYGPVNTIILSRGNGTDKISKSYPENLPDDEKIAIEIIDNQIMRFDNRDEFMNNILTRLTGLQFYLNDYLSTGICFLDICDRYSVNIGDNTYSCVMFNDEINITQGLEEIINTESPNDATETDYSKTDKTDRNMRRVAIQVDKQNGEIQLVAEEVGEIAASVSGSSENGIVYLNDVRSCEPVELNIRPIGVSISYLYPRNNLYPSSSQYLLNRMIRFHNITTNENYDYELPTDLLYYDDETYDELIMDYTKKICRVYKKCGYDANGNVVVLDTPQILNFPYPLYYLKKDGNYSISLLGYRSGYIYVNLIKKTKYSSQNASRAEIKLTPRTISMEVSNQEKSAGIKIHLYNEDGSELSSTQGNIELTGLVSFTDLSGEGRTIINGSNITTGTINADLIKAGNVESVNYEANVSGTKINLINGEIDTKNFKVSSNGTITGSLNGQDINITNINASNISSGTLNLSTGQGAVKFGQGTNHLQTTGLNIGIDGVNAGIDMNLGGIGNCTRIANDTNWIEILPTSYLYLVSDKDVDNGSIKGYGGSAKILINSPKYGTQEHYINGNKYYFITMKEILDALANHNIIQARR